MNEAVTATHAGGAHEAIRRKRHPMRTGLLFISPWLVGFFLLTLWPFLATLYWSFCRYDLLSSPEWIGTGHYERIASEIRSGTGFGVALWNTFYFVLLTVPGSVVLGVSLAVLLSERVRGQAGYRAAIFLPSIVPTVATSIVWMGLFDPQSGLVNQFLSPAGLQFGWLNSGAELLSLAGDGEKRLAAGSKDALAIMSLWGIGNFVVIYLAALQDVPTALHEAAELDGAGRWSRFWNVTRPQLSPVIFFNVIMGIVSAVQYFTQAYIVSGGTGGPENSTRVLSLHLFLWGFKYQEAGYASAAAWTLFVLITLLTLTLYSTSRTWVSARR